LKQGISLSSRVRRQCFLQFLIAQGRWCPVNHNNDSVVLLVDVRSPKGKPRPRLRLLVRYDDGLKASCHHYTRTLDLRGFVSVINRPKQRGSSKLVKYIRHTPFITKSPFTSIGLGGSIQEHKLYFTFGGGLRQGGVRDAPPQPDDGWPCLQLSPRTQAGERPGQSGCPRFPPSALG
jgi:hypothetical protein